MMNKTLLTLLGAVASLALVMGCSKKAADTAAADTTAAAAAAPGTPAPIPAGEVGACPTPEVPQGGTVKLLHAFTVKQAPDPLSPRLTNLGPGTFVDLKGTCGNWMKIMYPIGVGQLGPGWVELREVNNPTNVQRTTPPPVVTAPPVTTTTARVVIPPARPVIVVPKRK